MNISGLLFVLIVNLFSFQVESNPCQVTLDGDQLIEIASMSYRNLGDDLPDIDSNYFAVDPTWSPDSRQIAISHWRADERKAEIRLWDWDRNLSVRLIERSYPDTSLNVAQKAWSPDSRYLAIASNQALGIWNFEQRSYTLLKELVNYWGMSNPVWSPNSRQLALITNSSLKIWDIASGDIVHEVEIQDIKYASDPIWSETNGLRWITKNSDDEVSVWEFGKDNAVFVLAKNLLLQITNNLSPTGQLLAGQVENRIEIWNVDKGELFKKLDACAGIKAWSQDEVYLATLAKVTTTINAGERMKKEIQIWSVMEAKLLYTFDVEDNAFYINELTWSPDGKHLAFIDNEDIIHILELPRLENEAA